MSAVRSHSRFWRAALLVLPLLFGFTSLRLATDRGPLWLAQNSDPSYQYLLNSLLILQGLPPCHVDHPGTTVQIIGARVVALSAGPGDPTAQTAAVLTDPERFLAAIHFTLLTLSVLAFIGAGWLAYEITGSRAIACLVQLVPLLQPGTWRATLFVDPEALLLSLTSGFVVLALIRALALPHAAIDARRFWLAGLLGLVGAAALVTKITFAPLCLLALIVAESWRERTTVLLAAGVGVVINLAPAASQLPRMAQWFGRLASHSGTYGGGSSGFVDLTTYPAQLGTMLTADLLLPLAVVASLVTGWRCRHSNDGRVARLARLLLAVAALQILGVLLVAKHPHPRYLLPLALSVVFNFGVLAELWRPVIRPSRATRLVAALLLLAAGGATGFNLVRLRNELRAARESQLAASVHATELTRDGLRVDYYRSSSPAYALHFGNGSAWRWFAPQLAQIYPGRIFFNVFTSRFETFGGPIPTEQVPHDRPLYLVGAGLVENLPGGSTLPPQTRLRLLARDPGVTVHRLDFAP